MNHFAVCLSVLFVLVAARSTNQAPAATTMNAPGLQQLVQTVQQVQDLAQAQGLPLVQNTAQKVLNQLSQFTDSDLFFGNPCTFFQNIFRTFLCTISSLDPTGRNPAIQGLLQFLNVNDMFFNFAQTFFCPFGAFGGGGGGTGTSTGTGNDGTNGGGAGTGNGNSLANGCTAGSATSIAGTTGLDDPVDF